MLERQRMPHRSKKIAQAWLESPTRGIIELAQDWRARHLPPLSLGPQGPAFVSLARVPDYTFGCESGYFVNRQGEIFFYVRLDQHAPSISLETPLYLAGDFNGWQQAVGQEAWRLLPASLDGHPVLLWAGQAEPFFAHPFMRFKFVTGKNHWVEVPADAPNRVYDDAGNVNREINPDRTGQHLFQFTLTAPLDLSASWSVYWQDGGERWTAPLMPGAFFYQLESDVALGAMPRGQRTVFRLFAPRARAVVLALDQSMEDDADTLHYPLVRRDDGVWELTLDQNLHGWYYWYHLDGPSDAFGLFNPEQRVLDPYAWAAVSRNGPGIVLDRAWVGQADRTLATPPWQDLVVMEAHVRDLTALAPVKLTPDERRGFAGLTKWVESPDFYLHRLGVNCVELQPIQEFDNVTLEEYHWGYMTNAWFAPESSYALDPRRASGVKEFQALVAALHRRGIAVVLDVVYNHVGLPAHLMYIDKLYYFEQDGTGTLANWSGCGNDVRASAAMARRLIIDSCRHLIEVYGVDGFRFDLAELLGLETLQDVEKALKQAKPDVILIAEPWSFRGHLAGALRDTGWASWNDGYRDFLGEFVRGGGSRESFEYFLKGSPWHFAKWPAQTVNYTESHDDRTWIDVITENGDGNGHHPTATDRRRTHLMAAVLFASIGIPMLASGQDFLRSKQGVRNTYQRGDLNALDYRRIYRYPATHAYFADWIAFRRSEAGRLLRQYSRPSEGFFAFHFGETSNAAAIVYNADFSQGRTRLLFAVNPTLEDACIPIGPQLAAAPWRQLADHERFHLSADRGLAEPVEEELFVPALGCGLWVAEK